jgi:tetratricopeptide (TPR) repeat protein
VLLSGEPGIGKSRLIVALEERLGDGPHTRIRLACSPQGQDTPLDPILRQFERAAGFAAGDDPEAKRRKLDGLLSPTGCSELDVALVADLLSIPGAPPIEASTLPPHRRRELTFAAVLRHLAGLARQSPTLLIVEDVHWADPTTRELLDSQIEAIEGLPLLLVMSARPEYQPEWVNHSQVAVQVLGRLHRRHAASMIGEISAVSREQTLPEDVTARIITRADGMPLFIEELTKTVLETGAFAAFQAAPATEPLSVDVVPSSLQASLMARLDRLDAGKEVAQIGSIAGRTFTYELLRQLSRLPVKRLTDGLARLVQAGLATARGEPPDAAYTFKHVLLQDAAYASLPLSRRSALHLRLAEILEGAADAGANTEPELIAWHFGEAGAAERSIDFYLRAAERAQARFALVERVNHLRNGLNQLDSIAPSPDRLRRELELRMALGQALIDQEGSGNEEVRTTFERARELCVELQDTERLLVVLDGLVLNYHFAHSESEKMLSYANELLAGAGATGDDRTLLWAMRMRASANLLRGHFDAARDDMEAVIAAYDQLPDDSRDQRMVRDPRVSTSMNLGICLTLLGYPQSGLTMSRQGLGHAELLNHPVRLMSALRRACTQGIMQRDTASVLEFSQRLLTLNVEYETFVYAREGQICQGWATLRTERDKALVERVLAALEQLDAAKHWVALPFFMMSIGEILGDQGDEAGAVALIERAAELVERSGERWCEAEIIRLQARFIARDPDEATALLEKSLAVARRQNAKFWELRSAASLAELRRRHGETGAAEKILAPVYAWFSEGFEMTDLSEARTLLEA